MANQSLPSQSQTQPELNLWQKITTLLGWKVWAILIMLSFGVTGYAATAVLLNFNESEDCETVFWPLASGSQRLYCAHVMAQEGDAESLIQAINLIATLPEDHPLRQEINQNIQIWSEEILVLGEQHFQAGNWEEALAIAEGIPEDVASQEVIAEKKARWQEIRERGQEIEDNVEAKLYETEWNAAFDEAGKLVDLDNDYFANRRYQELISVIEEAQAEGEVLEEAQELYSQGGVDNLLEALEKAEEIGEDSYSYRIAQSLITDVGKALMTKAEDNLEQRNWQLVLQVTQAIPSRLELDEEVADLRAIALAGSQAQLGTVGGLEEAIARAEELESDRPFYRQAQNLIGRWENEIDDIKVINQAKDYARGGSLADFRDAIEKADDVPRGNPRYQEAVQLQQEWTRTIQVREDRPILNRARNLARNRNIEAYESAITVASQIDSNRALYSEARQKIANWRAEIQRIEDRPILSEATRLANQGRLEDAIAKAEEIGSNRALYSDAQERIRRWRNTITARESIEQAQRIAQRRTQDALLEAIETIAPARNSDQYRQRAERLINQWSQRIYSIALQRADQENLISAIRVAEQIPSHSGIYQEVRGRIQEWEQELRNRAEEEQEEEEETDTNSD
ncbi:hypothetical protein FRE64_00610 [Euhalothece natronophila Z-M001]|uniref:Chromosome segregation ATPase n=1 Tax=Euhalothece natronophila Z-M001 TaxID=522448 RepID=A0A5B8NI42_9CHRO|nr:hypothetical protein [Euhalothece natronophila]QDZ38576.1 hypothetical protein FRE64_00610 [Euhalothece natronophila Z-M001]